MATGGEPRAERPLTEQGPPPPRPDVEPIRWEDEDALFAASEDGLHGGDGLWPDEEELARREEERQERERYEHAKRSRNPVVRMTAGLPRSVRVVVDWVVTIVGAVAIVLLIKAFVVNPYRIPSSSMEPTLHCARPATGCESRFSDRVLANRFVYRFRDPARGDIVVFETPPGAAAKCGAGGTFVKRLVALPGETWEQRGGTVYIDGKKLIEPYVKGGRRDSSDYPKRTIPEGKYFFMGDNRAQSCDSREWGAVPRDNIVGEVFFVYWPPMRIGFRAALVLLGFVLIVPFASRRMGGRRE
jgi:signal peptidase I